jgi:hypothetical protein
MPVSLCVKTISFIQLCLCACHVFSQTDSTRRHISAIQIEISSAPWVKYSSPSQQQLQTLAPAGIFLNRDVTGYTKQDAAWYSGHSFRGMAGIKIFLRETRRSEIFAGVRYGQAMLAGTFYSQSFTETAAVFVDSLSGRAKLEINEHNSSFFYTVLADRIYLPMGITFFSRQRRLFWISAGVELCPFINFSYLFQSGINYFHTKNTVDAGERFQSFPSMSESEYYTKYQKMKGMSIGGYIGVPLALHLHPFFKSVGSLSRYHLFATLLPVFVFSSSEFSKPVTAPSLVVNAGIRYSLR